MAPEVELFHILNYDAVTLGNHEFDMLEPGVDRMLTKAAKLDVPFVVSNAVLDDDSMLSKHFQRGTVSSYLVKDVKITAGGGGGGGGEGGTGEKGAASSSCLNEEGEGGDGQPQSTKPTPTVKVGILGLTSPDASFCSAPQRTSACTFVGYNDTTSAMDMNAFTSHTQKAVNELRDVQGCQVLS
jgi:2',3'-cyclic-nucleotide 2'-phosphodiesterase (5'-nucleotidase family)